MLDTIPVPAQSKFGAAVARRLNASRPIAPAGSLAMSGPTGTGFAPLPANLRDRRAAAVLHPWKVFAVGKSADVDHCFEINVPDGAVYVGTDDIEVEGITPVDGADERYTLDCEGDISGAAVIYLVVSRRNQESEGSVQEWTARIIATLDDIDEGEDVLSLLPIADLMIDSSGYYEKGTVSAQYAHSSAAFENPNKNKNKDVGCYYITRTPPEDPEDQEQEGSVGFGNCYVQLAGKLYEGPSSSFAESAVKGKFLAIVADVSSASGDTSFQFQTYASLVALQTAQEDPDNIVIPLYKFDDDGAVECDFRTVPYEWQMNHN